jgi:NDP-sugar pyrophosphorylase family protein
VVVNRRSDVSAVILAGVHNWGGSRFESLAPRPLLPIALTPLICYSLDWLSQSGIERATVCANSATGQARAVLGNGSRYSMALDYACDVTPRGTAGCVRDAADDRASTFVVVDATTIPAVDLDAVLETHEVCGAAATVVVHQERFAQDRRWGLLVPGGIVILDRRVLKLIPERGFQDIKEGLIPKLHSLGERVVTHIALGVSPQVLNAGTYLAVNHWMIGRLTERPPASQGFHGRGQVMAHATARIAADARIVGPVLIGPAATIGKGATIVGPAAIGAGCRVERDAVLSRSIAWNGCVVGRQAVVDGCILADGAAALPREQLFGKLVGPAPSVGRPVDPADEGPTHIRGGSPGQGRREHSPGEAWNQGMAARMLHHYAPV